LTWSDLPTLNAALNGASALFLATGYAAIRLRRVALHRACMLAAVGTSILFLVSYLVYHARAGSVPYRGTGLARPLYFAILLSHTILAAAVVPLVIVTVRRALLSRFEAHVRLARWTLPIWLYVSVTGVVVYLMLYRLGGAG
jgi:uncharacterized membrane protein YozB (DUF420 family)